MRNSITKRGIILVILLLSLVNTTTLNSFSNLVPQNNFIDNKALPDSSYQIKLSAPLTPSGIRITSDNDSSNSMVITWFTTEDASDPKVIYSTDPSLAVNITVLPTSKYVGSGYNTYIYSANLKNLEPNTTYYYKISSDSSEEREILNFRTTPIRNASSSKFLLFGDSRSQPEQRNELAKKIMENFDDIEFTIHTGDIVADGGIQTQWNEYFNNVEILTKNIPGYYIEGNHEEASQYMYDNIPLPSNGLNSRYYNFSIGAISFIGLNTERDISEQTTWLEKTLKFVHQDNNTLWKIVYMHQPFFNSRSTRPDRTDLITVWGPLFEEYNVDFVFAGHNHYYERSCPMNLLKEYDDTSLFYFENPQNPMYFITGGAGAPLYVRDTNPTYAPFYNSTYHFIIAEVIVDDFKEETILKFETWGMPNDYSGIYLIDNLTVVKKGAFLNIHNPIANQLFGKKAPQFNISIDKVKLKPTWFKLNKTWYSIDGGKTNYTITGTTGTINQTIWDSLEDGIIGITFYANDSLGNLGYSEILVHKDTIAPNITIVYPHTNDTFGISAPIYTVIIKDEHLHSMWYTFNESLVNIFFTNNSTINQNEWNKLSNGTFKLIFYANDSVGNINYVEIIINKEIFEDDNFWNVPIVILSLFFFIGFLTIGLIAYTYLIIKRIRFKKM